MIELNIKKESKPTTHNRVFVETSQEATMLANRWKCNKQEVYRWLVKMALEYQIEPSNEALEAEANK